MDDALEPLAVHRTFGSATPGKCFHQFLEAEGRDLGSACLSKDNSLPAKPLLSPQFQACPAPGVPLLACAFSFSQSSSLAGFSRSSSLTGFSCHSRRAAVIAVPGMAELCLSPGCPQPLLPLPVPQDTVAQKLSALKPSWSCCGGAWRILRADYPHDPGV